MANFFDSKRLWYSTSTKKYYHPCSRETIMIATKINNSYGGILLKGNSINLADSIACYYPVIVVKDHPCVLIKCIGHGAFGKVYKGFDMKNNKAVAVKAQPMSSRDRILKQADFTRANGIGLADPYVNLGPSFLADGNGYFILPLADTSFDNWVIQKNVSGQYKLIIKSLVKIGQDLNNLHKSGKVHMDLKADNILVVDDIAYIGDFGESQPVGAYIPTAKADHRNHCHCAPEYFCSVNTECLYLVSIDYDLFSFGYLLKNIGDQIRKRDLSQELKNISKYIHKMKVSERKSLDTIIEYLKTLESKY